MNARRALQLAAPAALACGLALSASALCMPTLDKARRAAPGLCQCNDLPRLNGWLAATRQATSTRLRRRRLAWQSP